MYQGEKIAFQNALFLGFFQSAKPSNLQVLLTRSEMRFRAILLHLCVVTVIPKLHVKIILIDQAVFLPE